MLSSDPSDEELGHALREVAAKTVFSPHSLLTFTKEAAEHYGRTVLPQQALSIRRDADGIEQHARLVAEHIIGSDDLKSFPEWCTPLLDVGFVIEKWRWNDGVEILRFKNAQGLVIGGKTL